MSGLIDLEAIRRDHPLEQVAGGMTQLKQRHGELVGLCPLHSEKTPSFTLFAKGGQWRWWCHGCGRGGDVLDLIMAAHNVGLRDAAGMLAGGNLPVVQVQRPAARPDRATMEEAEKLWGKSSPIAGTLAERYLRSHAITIRIPDALRFVRTRYGAKGDLHPVMLALVVDKGGNPQGVQRTYLNAAGTGKAAVPKPKLSLGHIRGGAVRLTRAGERGLILTEGVEDLLSNPNAGSGRLGCGGCRDAARDGPARHRAIGRDRGRCR